MTLQFTCISQSNDTLLEFDFANKLCIYSEQVITHPPTQIAMAITLMMINDAQRDDDASI